MTNSEKIAFRILASLYPDKRPSEIRIIINKALAEDANEDDVELWVSMCKDITEKKDDPVPERIIERHYYHNYPWYVNYTGYPIITTTETITLTCDADVISTSDIASNGISSTTISASSITL